MARQNGFEHDDARFSSNAWNPRTKKRKSRPRPRRRFPAEVLSPEEVAALMNACSKRPTGVRNCALIAVLYRAGLRITEALSLYQKDLDPRNGAIRVLNGKGGKARTVGMDEDAFAVVQRWLDLRAKRGIDDGSPVFCMLDGSPLSASYVRLLFSRLGQAAGLAKRVHPHGLRHTHAAELRAEGVDVGIISKQLGHCSIATTARYLDHIAPVAVIEAMARRAW